MEDLRRRIREVDFDLVHLAERRRRDGKEAVEDRRLLLGLGEQDEATACRPGQRAFGHEGREHRREGRVDARAALAERPRARLGRVPVPGRDRAAHGEAYDLGDTADPPAEGRGAAGSSPQRRKLGSSRSASEPARPPGS